MRTVAERQRGRCLAAEVAAHRGIGEARADAGQRAGVVGRPGRGSRGRGRARRRPARRRRPPTGCAAMQPAQAHVRLVRERRRRARRQAGACLEHRRRERGRLGEMEHVAGVHPAAVDVECGARRRPASPDGRPRRSGAPGRGSARARCRRGWRGSSRGSPRRPRARASSATTHSREESLPTSTVYEPGSVISEKSAAYARFQGAGLPGAFFSLPSRTTAPSSSRTSKRSPLSDLSEPTIATLGSDGELGPPTRIFVGRRERRSQRSAKTSATATRIVPARVRIRPQHRSLRRQAAYFPVFFLYAFAS